MRDEGKCHLTASALIPPESLIPFLPSYHFKHCAGVGGEWICLIVVPDGPAGLGQTVVRDFKRARAIRFQVRQVVEGRTAASNLSGDVQVVTWISSFKLPVHAGTVAELVGELL